MEIVDKVILHYFSDLIFITFVKIFLLDSERCQRNNLETSENYFRMHKTHAVIMFLLIMAVV